MTRTRPDRVEITALAFIAVLALTLLTYPRFIGVADQGDFFRLMYWGKFVYPSLAYADQYVGWIHRTYSFERSPFASWWGLPSSEFMFIKAAAMTGFVASRTTFDLGILGAAHTLGFVIAWSSFLPVWRHLAGWSARAAIPLILLIFCDIGYLAYFHSFYAEPASLIFIIATIATGLHLVSDSEPGIGRLILFYFAAVCLVTAKTQNAPFAVALLPFVLYLHTRWRNRRQRLFNLAGVTILVSLAAAVVVVTPAGMRKANLYNSVFNGILRSSSNVEADLADLGLPKEFEALRKTSYFDTGMSIDIRGQDFQNQFYERISTLKVAGFYLSHPGRFVRMANIASARAYTLQPPLLGNFEKSSGLPFGAKATRWTIWSRFKERYLPHGLWFTMTLIASILGAIAWQYRRHGSAGIAILLLSFWFMLVIALVTPIPGDGENDLEKHLFNFNAILDLFVVLFVSRMAGAFLGRDNGTDGMSRTKGWRLPSG